MRLAALILMLALKTKRIVQVHLNFAERHNFSGATFHVALVRNPVLHAIVLSREFAAVRVRRNALVAINLLTSVTFHRVVCNI